MRDVDEETLYNLGIDAVVTYSGGDQYDAFALIDVDVDDGPSTNDYLATRLIDVDGDTFVDFVYPTDFALVP